VILLACMEFKKVPLQLIALKAQEVPPPALVHDMLLQSIHIIGLHCIPNKAFIIADIKLRHDIAGCCQNAGIYIRKN